MPRRLSSLRLGMNPPSARPAAGGPPVNTSAPTISGIKTQGQTLTAAPGSWTGLPSGAYAYEWQRWNGSAWAAISGATASTYVAQAADVSAGANGVRVKVTATNTEGSASAYSDPVTIAAPLSISGSPPSGTVGAAYSFLPTISGGRAPRTLSYGGAFPAGITKDPAAGLGGTPSASGTATGLTITVTDADGLTAVLGPFSIAVAVAGGGLAVVGTPNTTAVRDALWTSGLSATGGSPPYTFEWEDATKVPPYLDPVNPCKPLLQWSQTGLRIRVRDSLGATALSAPFDLTVSSPTVGGYQVGDLGAAGTLYEGYVLSYADDFDLGVYEGLITGPGHPYGRYTTTKNYTVGPRGQLLGGNMQLPAASAGASGLGRGYDTDPLHTGHRDSARGNAPGYGNMTVAGSEVALQLAKATDAERRTFNGHGKYAKGAALMGSAAVMWDIQAAGDIIAEYYGKNSLAATNPAGSHFTYWTWNPGKVLLATGGIGTASGATTDGAAYPIGSTVIGLAAAGSGNLKRNDYIKFAGDSRNYRVISYVPNVATGGVFVTIGYPGLRTAIPATPTAITVQNPVAASDIDEFDYEANSRGFLLNLNRWTNGGITNGSDSTAWMAHMDETYRWISYHFVPNTRIDLHVDSNLTRTATLLGNPNSQNEPGTPFFTNHPYGKSTGYPPAGDPAGVEYINDAHFIDPVANSKSPNGMVATLGRLRVWRKVGKTHYRPKVTILEVNIDCGAGGVVHIPPASVLWGATPTTEEIRCIPLEVNEHGMDDDLAYTTPVPEGVVWDVGTRDLTLDSGVATPGRLTFIVRATDPGGTCEPARVIVNVGPKVNVPSTVTWSNGQTLDIDVYHLIDCGILTSNKVGVRDKSITVTGLPAGVTFNAATDKIEGTITAANGSSGALTITGTNNRGQSASGSCTWTLAAQSDFEKAPSVAWYAADDVQVDGNGNLLKYWNKAALHAHSNLDVTTLTAVGAVGNGSLKRVANASPNGLRPVSRLVRDGFAPPRALAQAYEPVSQICNGNDKPFTVVWIGKMTSTDPGIPWSWGQTLPGTTQGYEYIAYERNNGDGPSNSLFRRVSSAGSAASGGSQLWKLNEAKVLIVAYEPGVNGCRTYFNSTTPLVSTVDTAAFSEVLSFALFARFAAMASNQIPSFGSSTCNLDFMECKVFDRAVTQAEVEAWMPERQSYWFA